MNEPINETIQYQLDLMIADGLVQKHFDENRQEFVYSLTEQGKKLADLMFTEDNEVEN